MATLATIATIATGAAAVIGAGASVYQGYLSYQAAQDAAHADEVAGTAEFASSQRDAQERRLEGALILSRQQAAAAASGGGAGNDAPTIVRLLSETVKRIDYGVASTMYGGESRRNLYYTSAENRRKTGVNTFLGSVLSGVGELAAGAGRTGDVAHSFGLI